MCDTIVALQPATADHNVLFGKNSDRERNEAQAVEFAPRAEHPPGAALACTYIAIPQARRTHAALLCRPFWMWGAEMGANEHGVVIGNEAVHARAKPQEDPALTGMDLLRLALERAASAAEAIEVITALLERHGQGGSCGHLAPRFYHNSFIVADATEAFVLETMHRHWLVQRVRDVRSISNAYSIGRDADRVSAGLKAHISDAGWSRGATPDDAPDYATVIEAETALAELRQRLTEVDVTDTVAWAHVARDVSGMLNAISLRTEPEPGPLADAAYAIAATATINRTVGDRRRWLGRAASRSAASALMAQRPARSSRELMQQVSYMVNQITQMHLLAAQEQRAREVELRAYDTLQTWLNEHPPVLAPADAGPADHGPEAGGELTR